MTEELLNGPWCATHNCPLSLCPHDAQYLDEVLKSKGGVIKPHKNECEHGVDLTILCVECSIPA